MCLAIITHRMTEQEAELREEVALWRNLINEWGHEKSETVRRIQDALSHAELKLGMYLVAKARLAHPAG